MHENRETSETPAVKPGSRSAGEGDSRTVRTYVSEESHDGIVPMNYSNNDKTRIFGSVAPQTPVPNRKYGLTSVFFGRKVQLEV